MQTMTQEANTRQYAPADLDRTADVLFYQFENDFDESPLDKVELINIGRTILNYEGSLEDTPELVAAMQKADRRTGQVALWLELQTPGFDKLYGDWAHVLDLKDASYVREMIEADKLPPTVEDGNSWHRAVTWAKHQMLDAERDYKANSKTGGQSNNINRRKQEAKKAARKERDRQRTARTKGHNPAPPKYGNKKRQ